MPMDIIKKSLVALSSGEITEWLLNLRKNCYVEQSNFAVSSVILVKQREYFIYGAGVNVENSEHNRLGLHGEQNALATLVAYLGDTIQLSEIWVMGANEKITVGSTDPLANNFPTSCGHCRQILLSFATNETKMYSVSCNGALKEALNVSTCLPDAFSERDLNIQKIPINQDLTQETNAFFKPLNPIDLLPNKEKPLSNNDILRYFSTLKPHIINTQFKTSPITAVIVRLINGYYVPAVLLQDIAFLTTDAIFAVIAQAITRFGAEEAQIAVIHLYSEKQRTLEASLLLTGAEIQFIKKFASPDIPIFHYNSSGCQSETTLSQCLTTYMHNLLQQPTAKSVRLEHC